jgi:holo-[acyl-carrier protein] synthase
VGIDLVDVDAFRARFDGRDDLLASVFTGDELAYCRAQRRPWMHLAARFAAREATLKALGTGLAGDMSHRDVAVVRDEAGTPSLAVSGATARALAAAGLGRPSLSLAHTTRDAVAVVLFFPEGPGA